MSAHLEIKKRFLRVLFLRVLPLVGIASDQAESWKTISKYT